MVQNAYHSGKEAAAQGEKDPYSLDPKEEYDFDPVEVFKDFVKTMDEEYDPCVDKIKSETTKKILKTNTVKAAAYLSGAATVMGASIVASAAANDGSPMLLGLFAVPLTAKALHSAANTKLVKAFAHGIENFSKTVYKDLAPERRAIVAKLKKFKNSVNQHIENFEKGMVIVRPGPEGVNGKGTVVEKDINNSGKFVKVPRFLHPFFIDKNKGCK